jgi:AraC-like DNA-binding protein
MAQKSKRPERWLADLRSVIGGRVLAGRISLAAVASSLGTSPRTLQRRLGRHGVTYWALVEQSRFEIAGALLRETDLKVQEIAARIGYGTPGAFTRAFTGWAGRAPTAYRRAHAEGGAANDDGAKWSDGAGRLPVVWAKVVRLSEEDRGRCA